AAIRLQIPENPPIDPVELDVSHGLPAAPLRLRAETILPFGPSQALVRGIAAARLPPAAPALPLLPGASRLAITAGGGGPRSEAESANGGRRRASHLGGP